MLDLVDRPEMLRRIRSLGARLTDGPAELDGVREVRGRGLMLGVGLEEGLVAGEVNADLLARGLVANAPRPDTIRLLPPFILSDEQADRAVTLIGESLTAARA